MLRITIYWLIVCTSICHRHLPGPMEDKTELSYMQVRAPLTRNIVLKKTYIYRAPPCPPPWIEENEDYLTQLEAFRTLQRQREKLIAKHFADKWQSLWDIYQRKHNRNPTVAQTAQLLKKERSEIHGSLAKAESSLAAQIRTEKIGFAQFLHQQRVPAVTSPACECGWHSQTAKHIIRHCSLRSNRQRMLEEAGTTDYGKAVSTSKGLKAVTAWLMNLGLLSQFSLATKQLYQ